MIDTNVRESRLDSPSKKGGKQSSKKKKKKHVSMESCKIRSPVFLTMVRHKIRIVMSISNIRIITSLG